MTTEWKNKNDRFENNGENGGDSFHKHNVSIREFRSSHANVVMVNGPRHAAFGEGLLPLRVCGIMMETGGSAFPDDATDWSTLIPAWKVARYKLSQD